MLDEDQGVVYARGDATRPLEIWGIHIEQDDTQFASGLQAGAGKRASQAFGWRDVRRPDGEPWCRYGGG